MDSSIAQSGMINLIKKREREREREQKEGPHWKRVKPFSIIVSGWKREHIRLLLDKARECCLGVWENLVYRVGFIWGEGAMLLATSLRATQLGVCFILGYSDKGELGHSPRFLMPRSLSFFWPYRAFYDRGWASGQRHQVRVQSSTARSNRNQQVLDKTVLCCISDKFTLFITAREAPAEGTNFAHRVIKEKDIRLW